MRVAGASDPAVLAHYCIGERSTIFAIHNLSRRERDVTVSTERKPAHLFDILQNREHGAPGDGPLRFHLKPYAYLWLREEEDPDT